MVSYLEVGFLPAISKMRLGLCHGKGTGAEEHEHLELWDFLENCWALVVAPEAAN